MNVQKQLRYILMSQKKLSLDKINNPIDDLFDLKVQE
jgi:hypothetical protein